MSEQLKHECPTWEAFLTDISDSLDVSIFLRGLIDEVFIDIGNDRCRVGSVFGH